MTGLAAGRVTDAATLPLAHDPVTPGELPAADGPTTGSVALGEWQGVEVGVWEMTEGTMRDVEAEELFVVISGSGTVEFEHPPLPAIELGPGSVVRLEPGMRTVWTVRMPLRKVYLAP